MKKLIQRRQLADQTLFSADLPDWLIRLYAMRGIRCAEELDVATSGLLPPDQLLNVTAAAAGVAQAIQAQARLLIVGDYDADGATSSALAVSALRAMGAQHVDFIVPDRFKHGYGLSEALAVEAIAKQPNLIITVDNGIANLAGVAAVRAAGIDVLITDHHLAPAALPDANWIVNPNQPGCEFPSKHLAGVGVIFYLMAAVRKCLLAQHWFTDQRIEPPKMTQFLDLVALGTVADLVPLDRNNRILVEQGLRRIRAGLARPGIAALINIAKRHAPRLRAADFAFALGPRLNAAGRLEDMSIGIHCLLASDPVETERLANELNRLNDERKDIEAGMQQQAFEALSQCHVNEANLPKGLSVFHADWHQGVIGILASRLKEKYHRPVIVFALDGEGARMKGSARSVPGVHIRDVLQQIDVTHPGLILQYGGHAMAAGLSIPFERFETFAAVFAHLIAEQVEPSLLEPVIVTDGQLPASAFSLAAAEQLCFAGPWGQQFPEPLFDDQFYLLDQSIVGEKHLRIQVSLKPGGPVIDGICFFVDLAEWPNYQCQRVQLVYRLDVNHFNGLARVQLIVELLEPLLEPVPRLALEADQGALSVSLDNVVDNE